MTLAHRCAAAATLDVAALLAAGCAGEVGGVADVPPGPVEALFEAAWAQPPEGDVTAAVVRVEKLIAQCMTDAGFAYLPVDQPEAVAAPLTQPDPAHGTREYASLARVGDAEAAVRAELTALRTEAWSTLPAEPADTNVAAAEQSAQNATDRLAGREIATALADLTCRDDVAYDVEQQRITSEYQQRFYQVHRVELEAWVASSTDAAR